MFGESISLDKRNRLAFKCCKFHLNDVDKQGTARQITTLLLDLKNCDCAMFFYANIFLRLGSVVKPPVLDRHSRYTKLLT